jgi:hypothetical protein
MKNFNKTLVQILILAIALQLFGVPGILASKAYDISNDENYEKLMSLNILDEMDEFEFQSEENVKRHLFVKYAIKLSGLSGLLGADENSPFEDIKEGDPNYNEILMAYNLRLISGTSYNAFEPERSIKVSEAVKVLMSVLGYEQLAEAGGGYPLGYISVAKQNGLLKGISQSYAEDLNMSNFFALLINALDVEIIQLNSIIVGIGGYEGNYTINKKETILTQVFDIYQTEGVLNANEYTSLSGKSTLSGGEVSIDGLILKKGNTNAADLLGYYVECYYHENDYNQKVLLYIAIVDEMNNVVVVDYEDIEKEAVTVNKFEYYDKNTDRTEILSISDTATLIYNGGQVTISSDLLCPEYGEVTLINNSAGSLVDVIRVMDYKTMQVSSISKTTYTISGQGGQSIILDPDDTSYDVIIMRNNREITFSQIEQDSIISYTESTTNIKNIKYVNVSNTTVNGKIDSMSSDTVGIDGSEYKFAKGVWLSLGMKGTFYLDFKGVIAAVNVEHDAVYGFLNAINMDRGISNHVKVQIFTQYSNWVDLELDDRLRFNSSPLNPVDFYNMCEQSDYRQLIMYKVNNNGKIIDINFAVPVEQWSQQEETLREKGTFRLSKSIVSATYRGTTGSFLGTIGILPNTIIFMVPNKNSVHATEKSEFFIITQTDMLSGGIYNNIKSYDADRIGQARVCVIDKTHEINPASSFVLVTGVTEMIIDNDNTDITYGIKGYYGSELMSIPVKNKDLIDNLGGLNAGDVIQYSVDNSEYISNITRRYSTKTDFGKKALSGSIYSSSTYISGYIKEIDFPNYRLVFDFNEFCIFSFNKANNIWIYNKERNIASKGTASDITEGDYAFIRVNRYEINDIVIFR